MSLLLLVDGGTTNLRVTALDENHHMLGSARAEGGVRHTAIDGDNHRLKALLKDCIQDVLEQGGRTPEEVTHCVAYGMITSGMGLLEIPHLCAPVSKEDLRRGMQQASFPEIAPFPIVFIPGVRNFAGSVDTGNCSGMDMMRGEETEAVGLYSLLQPEGEAIFVLPGSHNKFVHMDEKGRILSCMTSISGELLDAVTHHTILAGAVNSGFCSAETYDPALAVAGAKECERSGLGRAAFAGRILNTLGNQPAEKVQSYLLGAVLAEDVKALRAMLRTEDRAQIFVAGKPPVQQAMCDVLTALGVEGVQWVDPALSARMGLAGALQIAGI